MVKTLAIHVLPDSNPANIGMLITQLAQEPDRKFETGKELIEYLRDLGQNTNDWVQSTAASMGILERTDEGIRITSTGIALAQVRDDVRADLLHFLLYTGWSAKRPKEFLQSWGYRTVCDQYWGQDTVALANDYLAHQVAEVISLAQNTFAQMDVGEFDEISFSRKSLRGVFNWLEALSPPVMADNTFKRRAFCSPELVMLALGHVLHDEASATGIDILLSPEKREQISRICLLDPDSLDRALDWTLPIFSHIITPGTTAGFYGRFVRLNRLPTMGDMVR